MLLLGVTPHISYDYYSPKPGATNHTSLATFSIPLSLRSTTQQISVCQPSPVPCPCPPCQLWKVSHHTSPQTLQPLIIIYPDPVLPTIPPLQHSPPQYLKISLQSMMAANVRCVCTICIYLRPGATLSCMKFSTTPLPHGNNTSRSIFGQKPVSLSTSSLPAV